MSQSKPVGLILSGGRSTRMGGISKALVDFRGDTLLAHILQRFAPQVDSVLLNIAPDQSEALALYQGFGLPLVKDIKAGAKGPLMGLASAFKYLDGKSDIVLCPCDAPFVPDDLVLMLTKKMQNSHVDIVCPSYQGFLQPTFALWNKRVAPRVIQAAITEGAAGLKALYSELSVAELNWPEEEINPFFNINTHEDLVTARRIAV